MKSIEVENVGQYRLKNNHHHEPYWASRVTMNGVSRTVVDAAGVDAQGRNVYRLLPYGPSNHELDGVLCDGDLLSYMQDPFNVGEVKMIARPLYWNKIKPFVGKNIIKVFTGIRRCGKSCLLQLIADELIKSGREEKTIISANFESLTDDSVTSVTAMMERVSHVAKENPSRQLCLFFDEIQELDGWEKMLNALLIDYPVDIYITGSNAHLLSGELATYLGGRYVEFPVFPLSFAEAMPVLASEGFSGNQALLQVCGEGRIAVPLRCRRTGSCRKWVSQ